MTTGHPNANAAFVTTVLADLIYKIATHYGWINLSASTALLVAGFIVTAVLFIGKRGIWPTLSSLWNGASKTVTGSDTQPKA